MLELRPVLGSHDSSHDTVVKYLDSNNMLALRVSVTATWPPTHNRVCCAGGSFLGGAVPCRFRRVIRYSECHLSHIGFDSACPPGFRTQLHVTTSLSTGGGPVSYVQLSEGGFQVVHPLGLWSRFSGVVKVRFGYG